LAYPSPRGFLQPGEDALADERSSRSTTRAEANRNIRMAVKRFDLTDLKDETWDFLCECGDERCERWITLTLIEYESLRQREEPILAPGHALGRAAGARRKAGALAEDAKALRAQADVQTKRAARNVRKDRDQSG
ncbi:MAG TPA: hypothetical protein VKB70_04315, partial [Gaiellaceae bacterium]|nr:hypothetical protein [Gaiellaceae bacterium]